MRDLVPALLLISLGTAAAAAPPGTMVKLTVRNQMEGSSSLQTIYYQPDRERIEYRNMEGRRLPDGSMRQTDGPRLAMMARCDRGKMYELNLDAKTYSSAPYPPAPLRLAHRAAPGIPAPAPPVRTTPTVRIETTTVDTGERKEMFGYTARHRIITRRRTPLAGSHLQPQVSIIDGWFIDFHPELSCRAFPKAAMQRGWLTVGNAPSEVPVLVDHGKPERGYAVQEVSTTETEYTRRDGSRRWLESKFERSVTIQRIPAQAALFAIPAGFRRVDRVRENSSGRTPWLGRFWQRAQRLFSNAAGR